MNGVCVLMDSLWDKLNDMYRSVGGFLDHLNWCIPVWCIPIDYTSFTFVYIVSNWLFCWSDYCDFVVLYFCVRYTSIWVLLPT